MSSSHNWQPRISTAEQAEALAAVCLHFDCAQKSHGLIQAVRVLDSLITQTGDGERFVYADEDGEQAADALLPKDHAQRGEDADFKTVRWTVKVPTASHDRVLRIMAHYECKQHDAYRTAYMVVGEMVRRQRAGDHVWCIGVDGGYELVIL